MRTEKIFHFPSKWLVVSYQNSYNKQIVFQYLFQWKSVFLNSMKLLGFIYELVTEQSARVIKMNKPRTWGALALKL